MSLIDDAKAKLRLPDYLVQALGEPSNVGSSLRWDSCPKCGPSQGASRKLRLTAHGTMFSCAKCGEHGDVIHAVQLISGVSTAIEAARMIVYGGMSVVPQRSVQVGARAECEATTACLARIFDVASGVKCQSAIDYLMNERCLTPNIILRAKTEGILRLLPSSPSDAIRLLVKEVGEDLLREGGFWRQGMRAPGIAFRPLMFFMPDRKSAEFRVLWPSTTANGRAKAIRYGVTTQPWKLIGPNNKVVSITEGAIDMLSIPCLNPSYSGSVYGVPGCNNWDPKWFSHLGGSTVYICFDNDLKDKDDSIGSPQSMGVSAELENSGQTWAAVLAKVLTEFGAKVINNPPKDAKDINKMLVARTRAAATARG